MPDDVYECLKAAVKPIELPPIKRGEGASLMVMVAHPESGRRDESVTAIYKGADNKMNMLTSRLSFDELPAPPASAGRKATPGTVSGKPVGKPVERVSLLEIPDAPPTPAAAVESLRKTHEALKACMPRAPALLKRL